MANRTFNNHDYQNMVRIYIANNYSSPRAAEMYHRMYPNRRQPDRRVFARAFARFQETGSVNLQLRRERVRHVNNLVDDIVEAIGDDPTLSVRRIGQRFGVSKSYVHRLIQDEGI